MKVKRGLGLAAALLLIGMAPLSAAGEEGQLQVTVQPTILSASIPLAVHFDIDPVKEPNLKTDNSGQLFAPTVTITNRSIVPIDVTIGGLLGGDASLLVNNADAVAVTGNRTMFALRTAAPTGWQETSAAADEQMWLTADAAAQGYRLLPPHTALAAKSAVQAHLFGRTGKGWKAEDTLVLKPVFIIEAASATVHTAADIGTPLT